MLISSCGTLHETFEGDFLVDRQIDAYVLGALSLPQPPQASGEQ